MLERDTGLMLDVLRQEVRKTVNQYCDERTHRAAMLDALSRPGLALHPDSPCRAGVLTLNSYYAIRGRASDVALQAAAAVELQMEAAYLFDDVADQQIDLHNGLSASEQLALAIAILTCGAAAASKAAYQKGREGSGSELLQCYHSNYINACCGQFLDAYLEKRDQATIDDAVNMTMLKSGSLGRFATTFGASIATDDRDIVALFGEFGFNLFTYLQLIDDLRDAYPQRGVPEDLIQHKKTVPLVFFYNYWRQKHPECDSINDIMLSHTGEEASGELRWEFEVSGAEVFCAIVAESFLNRAKISLLGLQRRLGNVEHLEQFVDSLTVSPQEIFSAA